MIRLHNADQKAVDTGSAQAVPAGSPYLRTNPSPDKTTNRQFVYFIPENLKEALLADIVNGEQGAAGIVYVKTNFAADHVAEQLNRAGITAEALHNNKSRRTSEKSFANFQNRFTRILVTTESAASKMDAAEVSFIVNYDLPVSAETYTQRLIQHRGLRGALPRTLSLCSESEKGNLRNINRTLSHAIEVIEHGL